MPGESLCDHPQPREGAILAGSRGVEVERSRGRDDACACGVGFTGNVILATHGTAAQQLLLDRTPSHVVGCPIEWGAFSAVRLPQLHNKRVLCRQVLYDPEPAMIRAIELARAARLRPLHVYFLMQSDSIEEQKYRSALQAGALPHHEACVRCRA